MVYILDLSYCEMCVVSASSETSAWKIIKKQYPDIKEEDKKYLTALSEGQIVSFKSTSGLGKSIK